MKIQVSLGVAGLLLCSTGAMAAGAATTEVTQRDVNQQQRIEQGLHSGALTTQEAGELEHQEARIDRVESRRLRDGTLTPAETARINQMQNRTSRDIYREKHDAATGDPTSVSSQRMQADVQRNVNQEQRIEQGAASGALTNHEVGRLERGQSRVDRREALAARDGHVTGGEQAGIQGTENRQSRHIRRQKHDAQGR
jgi:hypothetical protein